ncbi:MAG: ABC transporter permease [Solirubrobacteraceae bacterium]
MIAQLRTLLLFYRRHLRVQPLRELMAVVGVAAGVALLFAVQVAHHSITGSFEEITHGVTGRATLEVAGRAPEGFDQRVAEEVERMPGVRALAPVFEEPIVVVGPRGDRALTLVGANEQITTLGGTLSREFERAGTASGNGLLVLTEPTAHAIGAHPGSVLAIRVAERTEYLALAAAVPSDRIGALAESPVAAAPLPIVQRLAGASGRVTRILIEPAPNREASLRRALTARYGATLNVRPIATEAKLLASAAGPEKQVTLLSSAISIVAGIILAYNALLLAGDERRRFIVYLVEAGTPDSTILATLAFDALILGLVGAALGLLMGDVISLFAYRTVPGYITAAFAVGGQRVIGAPTILIALGGGLLAALAAAALPALAALRAGAEAEPEAVGRTLRFTHKLRFSEAAVFVCGALLVCVSAATSATWPQTTSVALVGLAAGLVICLPMVMRQLLRLAYALARRSSDPAAQLATAELRGSPTRSVALLATGVVAAFLMVVIGGAAADVQHAVRRGASDLLSGAALWIKPGGVENVYTTQPFAYAETQRRLEHLAVVSSVLPWRDSFLDLPGRRVWVLGAPPQAAAQIAPGQLVRGSLGEADRHLREGGWAAVSQTIASEYHLHLGARFTLPTPTGNATLRLAAMIANYGWLPGAIVMNGNDRARLWDSPTASELAVTLEPGVTTEQGKRAVEGALTGGSALTVQTARERQAEVRQVLGTNQARLNDTTIVVLIVTVVSVIALVLAAIWQRRDRIESLIAIGMGAGQFMRMVFYESGTVLLVGGLIGMGAGIAGQDLVDRWLHQTTGAPVQFAPAWQLGLRTLVIAAVVSASASVIAALQTVRFGPDMVFSNK